MTLDERLQALIDRHEALTQSVELLLRETQADAENIRALARIAGIHERRLSDLEG